MEKKCVIFHYFNFNFFMTHYCFVVCLFLQCTKRNISLKNVYSVIYSHVVSKLYDLLCFVVHKMKISVMKCFNHH